MRISKRVVACALAFAMMVPTFSVCGTKMETVQAADSFESQLSAFPESYRAALRTMHEAHPNWTFIADPINVDFELAVEEETNDIRTNLIGTGSYMDSVTHHWTKTTSGMFETNRNDVFDWGANDWVVQSAPNWVTSSAALTEFLMDPRSYLTEENIFAMLVLSFDSKTQTKAGVQAILQNTFMNGYIEGTDTKYADLIYNTAKANNINPLYVASKMVFEKGTGVSLGNGRYANNDTLARGVEVDGTKYYNYFNIGASGVSSEDIINNGVAEAMERGWTSAVSAIEGGIALLSSKYMQDPYYEDTTYYQKFAVNNNNAGRFWKQYQQDVYGAMNIGYKMQRSIAKNKLMDQAYTFKIPVYQNMPSTATEFPSVSGNPNYKMSWIMVNDTDLSFGLDDYNPTHSYDIEGVTVHGLTVDIEAAPIAETTVVYGLGERALTAGNNDITLITEAENGDRGYYHFQITAIPEDGLIRSGDRYLWCENGKVIGDATDLFDFAYYKARYADIAETYGDDEVAAAHHFYKYGMAEGRQGSAEFNVKYYRFNYPDLVNAFGDDYSALFRHYVTYGKSENRTGKTKRYVRDGIDYSSVYDYDYYIAHNADVKKAFNGDEYRTFQHFVNYGMNEGRVASATFDPEIYKNNYSDLVVAFGNNNAKYYRHYILYGRAEGRNATELRTNIWNGTDYSPVFDYEYYLAKNPDVKAAFGNDRKRVLKHFVNYGMNEGRQASASFNVGTYKNRYSDLRLAFGNNTKSYYLHYINYGRFERRTA